MSPSKLSIDGPLAQRRTASFTSLRLVFLPEPAVPFLLAATGVALGLARRGRRDPEAPAGGR